MAADFFWSGDQTAKLHWLAWDKLCQRKEEGGLGFRRLKESNLALLAKQAWRIAFTRVGVLQEVLGQKYFPSSNFFEARLGSRPSFTWRSLFGTRELLTAGLRWKIGDGSSIPILGQPWLPRPNTFQLITKPVSLQENSKVAVLISPSGGWDTQLVQSEFHPMDAACILGIEIPDRETRD
ncbi:UNVERIFIED_CONTAM: hypothetical protein Slati_0994300 [Sesamum latifolium]|uniref:Uncharacterized protein n=1 Tax=Sesamum latifolium TaxID=2727402 RepID=A0AAW2XWH5_9LAMI